MAADTTGHIGQKISIVGKTGSGKTTLAQQLAARLDMPHIELDALYWLPDWQGREPDDFLQRLNQKLNASERWIVDGNYNSLARPIVWQHADTVIWLDYPLWFIYWRLVRRIVTRSVTRQTLWSGNRESLLRQLSTDSLLLHARGQHQRHRRTYPQWLAQPEYQHLTLVHLRSHRQTQKFLTRL